VGKWRNNFLTPALRGARGELDSAGLLRGGKIQYTWPRGLGGPHKRSGRFGEEKMSCRDLTSG